MGARTQGRSDRRLLRLRVCCVSRLLAAGQRPPQPATLRIHSPTPSASLPPGNYSSAFVTPPGTALGDPVEVNAAAQALLAASDSNPASNPNRRQPLALLASKSWHGHAEPDAGLVALAHAASAAAASLRLPVLHLRLLNPYVAGVLESVPAGASRRAAAARQPAGLPVAGGAAAVVAATSSFAFMVRGGGRYLRF